MAALLEANPGMRAVVNFVPTLVEQLDDYADQFLSGDIRDPLLACLPNPHLDRLEPAAKQHLIEACFRLNPPTMLDPFPGFKRLKVLWDASQSEGEGELHLDYFSGAYLADLVTWYHLAWTGETVRRAHPWLIDLLEKGQGFSLDERESLFRLIGNLVSGLLPRYRALAARGQIELSSTPHSHPIAPLLLDFNAAREVRSDLPMPASSQYPGGQVRVQEHLQRAVEMHVAHFGKPPRGFWPAEGGVSEAALRVFSDAGVEWVATGEGVLRNSLAASGVSIEQSTEWLSRPYRLRGEGAACFFRDDTLSDLIGFEYKNWFARDAVRHFVHTLEERHRHAESANPVVSVILDGENAWEFYPYNGWYFLNELYEALTQHAGIRTTTYSEYLELYPHTPAGLDRLVAGSWVYGDFTTWIGDPAKNRAWDLLCEAKRVYDRVLPKLMPQAARAAEAQLRSCESSDWFWWFGDYNPGESVQAFDQLYRTKLKGLYRLLGQPVPGNLDEPLCLGGGPVEAGGMMRRGR